MYKIDQDCTSRVNYIARQCSIFLDVKMTKLTHYLTTAIPLAQGIYLQLLWCWGSIPKQSGLRALLLLQLLNFLAGSDAHVPLKHGNPGGIYP